uniref:beta-mannosidase n=1 Tax=uncultured bacterium A1Q1_fos_515 TaxID=1256581 RepID=L7VWA6_9BACT|nr:beta-mannosidase [uncultured bacterium A1Q1_fos_515]
MELTGTWRVIAADDELRRNGVGFDRDDANWDEIVVPSHWRTHPTFVAHDGPLLHRLRFEHDRPADGERLWIVFDGIFSQADVWLDGAYLGDPEGYFVPHAYDVTSLMRLGTEHVLAVEVTCAPQRGDTKRAITGAFQDPRIAGSWNPGGIWRPVRIERTGPVRIDRCRIVCRDANDKRAHLRVAARLDADAPHTVRLSTTVGGITLAHQQQSLAKGSNEVTWNLDVPEPSLWWPWSLGEQPLTDVTVEVDVDGTVSDRHTVRTGLREVAFQDWTFSVNGERLFTKGALLGPSRLALADSSPESLRHDLELAKEAGLDLVRLHRHIARPETYAAADELGMLLWQDFPLFGGYARSVRRQAVDQARAAVDLLGHHPSIVLWCGHDTPEAGALGQQLPTWNKTILDRWVKRAFERADESRPVIAHSGVPPHVPQLDGTDSNLAFGWERGEVGDLATIAATMPRMVRFVSGFGAQSVPDAEGVIQAMAWPDLDWAQLVAEHGMQRDAFEQHVPPSAFLRADDWRAASQRYQARVLRQQIETLRRLKYRPTGGFCFASLADAGPAISTAVLDHERRPKPAYQAVTEACRPVIVVADPLAPEVQSGTPIALDVHVVSDLRTVLDGIVCTAVLRWAGGSHRWAWRGDAPPDGCVRVGMVRFVVPDAPGDLWLDLTLEHGDLVATNRYEASIIRE